MATTLPQAADFGARESLKSNRLDMPGSADVATGEALSRAAGVFTKVVGERKDKRDRLNYSLAKNDLLQADIANREKLKGDEDYATYDERYSEGYNTARDEIYSKYQLTADDGAILDAESDLIRERGRVQVGDASHKVKRDNEQTSVETNLATAREQILSLDPASANELMLNQLDSIQAAVENGIYSDAEGLALSQKFVQDTATARLISMEPEDRIRALEQSLTKRKLDGAISVEDIQAGKGTGSIADFINRDTAQKMLEASQETASIDDRLTGAFSAVDEAFRLHPEPEDAKKRDRVIAELTKNMPDAGRVRKEANIIHRAKTASDSTAEEAGKAVEYEDWGAKIIDGTHAFSEIPADARGYMGADKTAKLLRLAEGIQTRDGFGEYDDVDTEYKWLRMTREQKAAENLKTADWMPFLSRSTWDEFAREQKVYNDATASGKDPNIFGGDNADEVLRDMLTGPNALFDRVPKPDTDEARRYSYLSRKVDRALKDASLEQYATTGSGKLLPQKIDEITSQVIGRVVYIDDWGSDTKTLDTDLTKTQKAGGKNIYIDIGDVRGDSAPSDSMGNAQNMEQYLRNIAGKDVSTRTVERAYYLWVSGDAAGAEELLTK